MKKKYNDNSTKFSEWTTRKLKQWALELDDCIYGENSCYGVSDMINLDGIMTELGKRKVVMKNKSYFD